ncbi:MAG: class II aldolase/adducin family protein [Phycisphaerae bacterium]|nr:class II aldolase/adducin family protein [Phycisphaerae bacterium]MDD5381178.1 class II aldolase/adducin family protein [Phycisphaerae bacterium]
MTSINKALADLISISNITGKDSALIQGGGGNTSVKTADGRFMYIKASGTDLKDMNKHAGWCKLRPAPVLAIIKDKSIAKLGIQARETKIVKRLLLACDGKASAGSRPSVEAHLHAMLGKCVIHLHPVAVLSFACAKNGRAELEKLFKNEKFPPLWVPYAHPGFTLANKFAKLNADYQNRFGVKPSVLFLQKHGLIISADSPNAALRLLRRVINRCAGKLKYPKATRTKPPNQQIIAEIKSCIHDALYNATGCCAAISYFYDDEIAAFWHKKNARKRLSPPALTPDELLYANGPAMWIEDCNPKRIARRLNRLIKKGKNPPAAFLVKGAGLFVAAIDKIAPAVRDIVKNSFVIRTNASRFGGILALNKPEQDFINRWEADAFRKKLANDASPVV